MAPVSHIMRSEPLEGSRVYSDVSWVFRLLLVPLPPLASSKCWLLVTTILQVNGVGVVGCYSQ